ncbi:hypothetical protein HOLleu_22487 [Holothuria leucospilota]|uniref:Uncharacterized protein n=1 Tax=Holothuria leucospilota TaxID=206669 RepID=A0A9Q1BYJ5_HOLLE|nr:hypothetical protein HOLleu_22487 [Holothuria leucospilota]
MASSPIPCRFILGSWLREYLPQMQEGQKWFCFLLNGTYRNGILPLLYMRKFKGMFGYGRGFPETKVDCRGHVRSCCIQTEHYTLVISK